MGGKGMISERYKNDGIPVLTLNEIQKKYIEQVNQKCETGVYEMESYVCECGNKGPYVKLSEKDRYGIKMDTVICQKCGLIMTNPRMKKENYDEFYENEYPYIYRAIDKPDDDYFKGRVDYGELIVKFIEEKGKPQGKSVLEIGCAGGGIVKAFEQAGYQASGVDLSPMYIEFGKRKGLNLRCCHSSELVKEGKTYDIIILNHVLEHFINMKEELAVIRKLLKPETGIFFVAVPGLKNLKTYHNDFLELLQNAHTYVFAKETLAQVMAWNGFKPIYVNDKVQGLFQIEEPVSKVDNYSKGIIKFLEENEKEREQKNDNIYDHIEKIISNYKKDEIFLYGKGKETKNLIEKIGKPEAIKGILTNDTVTGEYMGYPICDINHLEGIKCIIIVSHIYRDIIYERIKYVEEKGIQIESLYGE